MVSLPCLVFVLPGPVARLIPAPAALTAALTAAAPAAAATTSASASSPTSAASCPSAAASPTTGRGARSAALCLRDRNVERFVPRKLVLLEHLLLPPRLSTISIAVTVDAGNGAREHDIGSVVGDATEGKRREDEKVI